MTRYATKTAAKIASSAAATGASAAVVSARTRLCVVLFISNLLHPVDGLPVELLLNGDVGHRRSRRGAVPMLLARREPDHVPRPDLLDRASPALRAPAASGHD